MGHRTPICNIAIFLLQGPVLANYREVILAKARSLNVTGYLQMDPDPTPNPDDIRRMHGIVMGLPIKVRIFIEYAEFIHNPAYRHNDAGRKVQMLVDLKEDVDECLERHYSADLTNGFELR